VAFSLVHVWPFFVGFPLWKAVFFAIVPNYIMSALYLSISQAGHIVAEVRCALPFVQSSLTRLCRR
jgi:hypothetical protein